MKLEKLLNKLKKKLGKPMKNNQKQKRELNLIIGFGQIGSSIYDRFKYLKNNEDSKNDFDVKVFDIHQFKNENDFVTNKIETIRFGNYGKINFICCIDTKPGQDLFNNSGSSPNSNNKTFSSTLLKTFFENKEHFDNEDTEVNIIIESTVPVGSAEKLYHKIVKQDIVKNIMIFSSPERYLETYHPSDFPTRIDYNHHNHPFELHKDYTHSEYKIIGICDPDGMYFEELPYKRIQNYMDAWQNTGIEFIMVSNSNEAELSKLLENHLRYTQITTMNLFKDYIENTSGTYGFRANPDNIFEAMRTKGYINYEPGLIGGGCIPVDSDFLLTKDEMIVLDYPSFPRRLMDKHIHLNHEINARYKKNIAIKLQNLINVHEKLAIRKNTDLEIYFLGIGYKTNSPTTENSKILDIIGTLNIKPEQNIKLNFVDNFVEDYNNCCVHKPNFRKKQTKIKRIKDITLMNAPDYFVPDENEVKEYQILPFIDFIYALNKEPSNPVSASEPVRLIIINNDNDVKINNELTNYSSYLTYKEIEYFKIGELK
mgnify:CR=1 FL=1